MLVTSTSPGPASAETLAPMCTAMPARSSPRTSHSPVCRPERTSRPQSRAAPATACAHLTAATRPVERGEEAVAGRLDLHAAVALELTSDRPIVRVEELAPTTVADLDRALGRPDDVGEQDRLEDAVELDLRLVRAGRSGTPR